MCAWEVSASENHWNLIQLDTLRKKPTYNNIGTKISRYLSFNNIVLILVSQRKSYLGITDKLFRNNAVKYKKQSFFSCWYDCKNRKNAVQTILKLANWKKNEKEKQCLIHSFHVKIFEMRCSDNHIFLAQVWSHWQEKSQFRPNVRQGSLGRPRSLREPFGSVRSYCPERGHWRRF